MNANKKTAEIPDMKVRLSIRLSCMHGIGVILKENLNKYL